MEARWTVAALNLLVALGALWGGSQLALHPDGATVGAPLSLLQYSLFPDFRIPGLILFAAVGLTALTAALLAILRHPLAPPAAALAACALIGWILGQIAILRLVHWLHLVYLLLGGVILWLAWDDARAWLRSRRAR